LAVVLEPRLAQQPTDVAAETLTPVAKHTVRRTLLWLGAGVTVQRLCFLIGFVLVGRALGVAGLGIYAQGQAVAAILAVLAGAGISNVTARMVAQEPEAARTLIATAVRRRLRRALVLVPIVIAIAFATSDRPWFWVWSALHVLPTTFDLKQLLDASGSTRREIRLELRAAALQLLGIVACVSATTPTLELLAGVILAARCTYAIGAYQLVRRLPLSPHPVSTTWKPHVAIGQLAHELMTIADVWLCALLLGDVTAGLYAQGVRFAAAALLPSAQLARLMAPHLLHAGADGDAGRTLATAMRTTLLVTLPMLAGGVVSADALCRISGESFAGAAGALGFLLLAGCLQHLGWQCSTALLALHRDRAYAHGFWWPALLQLALLFAVYLARIETPAVAALWAAAAAATAQAIYALVGALLTRNLWRTRTSLLAMPLRLLLVTGGAAALPLLWADSPWRLPQQLALGGAAYLSGLWWWELRQRWRRLGDGLAAASGFEH
jgi:O-antigen/teichoic acid export membrane protein